MIPCFTVVPTAQAELWLRRYDRWGEESGACRFHSAAVHVGRGKIPFDYDELDLAGRPMMDNIPPETYDGDPRWPTVCSACGYEFTDDDPWQVLYRQLWERSLGFGHESHIGREFTLEHATEEAKTLDEVTGAEGPEPWGPGAMFDAWWLPREPPWCGLDGRALSVKLPPDGHVWHVDTRASNCTRRDEPCDCWCRHGEPPKVTVDKHPEPGQVTCAAGAGSIQTPRWHGFLRDGALVPA